MFGRQEKFFGWPNLYTPFNFNETKTLKPSFSCSITSKCMVRAIPLKWLVIIVNITTITYCLVKTAIFEAFHETTVKSLALSGRHRLNDRYAINYAGQFSADEIESTSLENNFTSRNYLLSICLSTNQPLQRTKSLLYVLVLHLMIPTVMAQIPHLLPMQLK